VSFALKTLCIRHLRHVGEKKKVKRTRDAPRNQEQLRKEIRTDKKLKRGGVQKPSRQEESQSGAVVGKNIVKEEGRRGKKGNERSSYVKNGGGIKTSEHIFTRRLGCNVTIKKRRAKAVGREGQGISATGNLTKVPTLVHRVTLPLEKG